MPIVVQDVPLANQILQRPGLSLFQKAVNLDDLLAALPAADRPSKSYHKPKLLQKLGLPRVYVSKDNDITDSLPLSSLKRNKIVWVPRSDARRLLKSRADELLPLDAVDEVDGVQYPDNPTGPPSSEPAGAHAVSENNLATLPRIVVPASEELTDDNGNVCHISVCGERTYSGLRYFVDHIYTACKYKKRNAPGNDLGGIAVEHVIVDGVNVRVVDFRNALRLFAHFDRHGSSFAMGVMDWCARTLFSIQYGDSDAPRPEKMAAYMRSVAGRTCPNPMAECTSKMLYLEIMGSVSSLQGGWPELRAFVPPGGNAEDYKVVKPGEGSGHRFGDNARAIKAVHPGAEPECYDFRPTTLGKRERTSVEKALASTFADSAVPPDPAQRFTGDTEILVMHKDKLSRAWKFIQNECTGLEEDMHKSIEDARVRELEHELEVSRLRATISQMGIAVQTLPPSARERFDAVMRTCKEAAH